MRFNPSVRFQPANAGRALGRSVNAHRALANTDYRYPFYHDGRMAKGFLYNIEQDARSLQEVLKDEDDMPQWVNWKIYTSADRLQAAARYMEREAKLMENPNRRKNPFKARRNFSPTEASKIPTMKTLGQLSLNNDEQKQILDQVQYIKNSLKEKTGAPADNVGLSRLYDSMPRDKQEEWNKVLTTSKSADRRVAVQKKIDALWAGHDGLIPVLKEFAASRTPVVSPSPEEEVVDASGETIADVEESSGLSPLVIAGGLALLAGGGFLLYRWMKS